MKVKIVGSGISGLAAAHLISEKVSDVEVLERNSKPGGLIECSHEQGILYHKVGGHVFNSKNEKVLDWFWSFFDKDKDFIKVKRNAKILLDNVFVGYPIENNLFQLSENTVAEVIEDLLKSQSPDVSQSNFKDYLLTTFGHTLCELYFFPYNEKIWQCDLREVSLSWLSGKLPMPNLSNIIMNNIFRVEESEMVHSTFYYPREGGSQFIADTLAQNLNVSYETEVSEIRFFGGKLSVNSNYVDRLIYTGRINQLKDILRTDDPNILEALNEADNFNFHGTSNLLCECDHTDISWLYLPDSRVKAHRIIYTGGFAPSNNNTSGRMSCTVEFSGDVSFAEMKSEITKLPGNLTPIAANSEPFSYVIQDENTRNKISLIKKELRKANIYLVGRFAEWEYFNMDAAIESASRLVQELDL